MQKEAIILISIVATMVPTLAFVMVALRRVSSPLVSSAAGDGSEWRLTFLARQGRKYRLCMRYEVVFEGGEDDFGLVVDYRCTTPQGEIRERAGVGSVTPPERDRYVGSSYKNSYTGVMGNSRQKATFILATVGPFPGPAELVAEGVVHVSSGANLVNGTVYFC